MSETVAILFLACIAIHWVTSAFFDDGLGGKHYLVLFWMRSACMALGLILALDVLGVRVELAVTS